MSKGLNQTVFNAFCAKKVAEVAPGGGHATTTKIVTPTGTIAIDQAVLDKMEPAYREQANPRLSEVEKAIEPLPFEGTRSDDGK